MASFVNPEYYDSYDHYDTQDSYDDPVTKKRKLMNMSVCVDHLRGYCPKGARCPKVHSDQVPSLDEREVMAKAKFCHDFQNRGACSRDTCRFLHVTRREEDEFLLTGIIPQSVFDRAQERAGYDNPNYNSFSNETVRDEGGSGRGMSGRSRGGSGGSYTSRPPLGSSQSDYYSPYDYGGYPPYEYNNWREREAPYSRTNTTRQGPSRQTNNQTRSFSQAVTYSNYCIDFLKGTCSKGSNCRLMHVDIVEDMDDREAIVKNIFCHDFQNKRCPRAHCKYIHANFDEQKVFIEEGYFSETLCGRNRAKMFFCDVCIDFLRNQCMRGSSCQYRHVTCVEEKDERICLSRSIFCRDFQEEGCRRPVCKLLHTSREDEIYFMQTGLLSEHLRGKAREGGVASMFDPSMEVIAGSVCRDYMKGICNRGTSCKFNHPRDEEAKQLISYQSTKVSATTTAVPSVAAVVSNTGDTTSLNTPASTTGISFEEHEKIKTENVELKQRIQQLERLLADACHCITLAVGDQNPAIQTLLQSIMGMAPESTLANKQ